MKYTKDNHKLVEYFYSFEDEDAFTDVVKDKYNTIAYYLKGKYHRTDGPAIEWANGDKEWYLNDKLHRTDGPAIERVSGSKSWWLNDKCYGKNDDFTNESWIRFVQLQILK